MTNVTIHFRADKVTSPTLRERWLFLRRGCWRQAFSRKFRIVRRTTLLSASFDQAGVEPKQ